MKDNSKSKIKIKMEKAILHTAGKTMEDIKKSDDSLSDDEIKEILEYYERWNGIEIYVTRSFDNSGYVLIGWDSSNEEIDRTVKEAIYLMEQDKMFGTYINERERFDKDWSDGEYSPSASIWFLDEEVEIITDIERQEETKCQD